MCVYDFLAEAQSVPSQLSKLDIFAEIVNRLKPLTISAENFISGNVQPLRNALFDKILTPPPHCVTQRKGLPYPLPSVT